MMDKTLPVLVSGASGYLASWLIKYLLEDGYNVHATVRDVSNTKKVDHLQRIAQESPGTLKLFAADLMNPGSFAESVAGCSVVFHTAAVFMLTGIDDPQSQLVDPAVKGTENILTSVNQCDSVKQVVLTSSVVAVMGDNVDIRQTQNACFSAIDWNQSSTLDHQPYNFAKTEAEKKAWQMHKAQTRWQLSTINPGFILGPSLTPRTDSTSISFMIQTAQGKYKSGLPQLYNGVVDVRDVALAHIKAAQNEQAQGRFILVCESLTLLQLAQLLKARFPERQGFASRELPKWLMVILAPMFERSRIYARRNFNIAIAFDNSPSVEVLGMDYRPVSDTLADHLQQLIDDGLV